MWDTIWQSKKISWIIELVGFDICVNMLTCVKIGFFLSCSSCVSRIDAKKTVTKKDKQLNMNRMHSY